MTGAYPNEKTLSVKLPVARTGVYRPCLLGKQIERKLVIEELLDSRERNRAMTRKQSKPAVVAFKVEEELAQLLDKLPNKSAFIRKAIAAHLLP